MYIQVPKVQAQSFYEPDLKIIINDIVLRGNHQAQIINGDVYIPVRRYCEMFKAKVIWNRNIDNVIIYHNGRLHLPKTVMLNSTAMMSVYNLNKIFDYNIEYFKNYNIVSINTNGYSFNKEKIYDILPNYDGYTEEDLQWLAKIIHAEANGEPYEGKLAVGNVILNRKKSHMYPNTIKEVIFDTRNGVQFSPTVNGKIYNIPSLESWIAAVEVLEGKRNAKGVLFFMNSSIAQSTWISNNRELAFTMKNHDFFY